MLLKGKRALVTGSSRGIGLGITREFLKNGAEVWGLCTKESAAKAEMEKLASENGTFFHEIYANLADAASLEKCVKSALANSGGFDVLVNNAGITRDGLSFRMKKEDWQLVIDVNLTAIFLICQIITADMIKKRKGSVINMSSIVGIRGGVGQVNYAASKAGLIGYTKSLAKEVGQRGVRVNAIAPGFIETDMTRAVNEKMKEKWLELIPMRRAGNVEDVANAAVFLASDKSEYITAQVLGVDGGM